MRFLDVLTTAQHCAHRAIACIPFGAKCHCSICGRRVQRFLPYRGGWADIPQPMKQLGIVGSDVENHECPACGCHDRERHLLMYLEASGLFPMIRDKRILHLAPERHLQRFIAASMPLEYVRGDLHPTNASIKKIDLQAVPYSSEYFDFVLANHVLEHVQDDSKALQEIFRILVPGGHAILQTPYARGLNQTFEDPAIQTDEARFQAYGQEDHLRLYGRDIFWRFEACGLRSVVTTHQGSMSGADPTVLGVNIEEPFFLFKKPV
jgi:SAM-dependent methyltransferase